MTLHFRFQDIMQIIVNNLFFLQSVYRLIRCTERKGPQKGRLREFVQCDIDIIGSSSISSEIELIHTTAKALLSLDIKDFTVKINDRRILRALLKGVGFEESQLDSVCITFDKMDKIGAEGVIGELTDKGFDGGAIAKFGEVIAKPLTVESVKDVCGEESAESIETIFKGR